MLAPGAGWNTTCAVAVAFDASYMIDCVGYVPPATSTVCPAVAAWNARSNDLHGKACEQAFESDPDVATKTDAGDPPPAHAAVETPRAALADLLPAASNASTASVYAVPQLRPEKALD